MSEETKPNMRCCVCDSTDKWENVDEYRMAPKGMHICNGCGFVGYPEKYQTEEEIKEHYREDYRPAPSINNLYTCVRKLHFHEAFLHDTFDKWKKEGKTKPKVLEIGAAFGTVLNWVRSQHFPEAELNGTELTTSFRRVAYHEYGLNLMEEPDLSKKYDIIMSYKVAEHQMDVDKRLAEYREALSDDGLLYISVPTWFDQMTNFGMEGFDLEYYYHPDHINTWTKKLFEQVLKKAGFEIIKHDGLVYDDTYLCKKAKPSTELEYEDPVKIKKIMDRIKQAYLLASEGKFKDALEVYPKYVGAWQNHYEHTRAQLHKEKQNQVSFKDIKELYIEPMMKYCGETFDTLRFSGDLAMRYENWDNALKFLEKALEIKRANPGILHSIAECYRQIELREKDAKKKIQLRAQALQVSRFLSDADLQARPQAITCIYADAAKIPTPFELGQQK